MDVLRADNSVKNRRNSTISDPKPDIYKINAHPKFGENPLVFSKVSSRNENTDVTQADNSVKKLTKFAFLQSQSRIYNMNAHTKFGEHPLTFTKVIIRKWKYGSVAGRQLCQKWQNLPINEPKQYQCTHRVWWKSIYKYSGIVRKLRMDGRMYVRQTDGQTHGQPMWYHNTPPLSCSGIQKHTFETECYCYVSVNMFLCI